MTFEQYILNPAGKNNAVLNSTAREAIRSSYKKKFDAILLREHGNINYRLYKDEKHNRYIAHFRIPSETIEKFYYDTVLEFTTDLNVEESGTNLFKYNVKFFSNDPAFTFTYAYVFYHNNLFIKDLIDKMSKEALKKAATEKNPGNQVGYVKTIYFAYLVMQNRSLNNVDAFKALASEININNIKSNITNTDEKIAARIREQEKLTKNKKKKDEKRDKIISSSENKPNNLITKVKNVITTKKTGITKTTKTTKRK